MTADEAFSFLSDVLCIAEPKSKLKADRQGLALLGEILMGMYEHIPWQTVSCLATPPELRHLPTAAEIKNAVSSKIGGLCYPLNLYGVTLLRALGYDVTLVSCTVLNRDYAHPCIIVHNLTAEGNKHLVDFGTSVPSFRPIPLDFDCTSPEYRDSHLRYRFVRRGDTIIRQHSIATDPGNRKMFKDFAVDGWLSFITIHANRPVDVGHFQHTMTKFYTEVVEDEPILTSLRCFAFPNGRLRGIKDTTLLIENKDGYVQKSYLRSRGDILSAFLRYFPQFSVDMVQAAMNDVNVNLDFTK